MDGIGDVDSVKPNQKALINLANQARQILDFLIDGGYVRYLPVQTP